MLTRRFLIFAAVAAGCLSGAFAQSQGQPIVGIQTVSRFYDEARIASVDSGARTATLAFVDGRQRTFEISPANTAFAAARVGEWVTLGIEDRVSFVLSGPDARPPRDRETMVAQGSVAGRSVIGVGAAQVVATRWVTGVDPAAGTISLVEPQGGPVRTYNVTTTEGREQLPRVKPGDNLTLVASQLAVVSIAPRR
ncbi:MAG: hypothetical protein KIT25_14870 [Enhydrobacter sp.]|nr:MAG: hypothetical protein KIT25_14870 [Enhydrobacter sp.]